jgi:glycine oxidase
MNKSCTIIGHGLAGCVMAMTLYRKHIPFQMLAASMPGEASYASSGLIAPVTGRRYVKAWNIDTYIASALDFYRWSESLLGGMFFADVEIVRFLSNAEAIKAWTTRMEDPEYQPYISTKTNEAVHRFQRPYGIVTGGYRLDTPGWLNAVREFLKEKELLTLVDKPLEVQEQVTETTILATGAVDRRLAHGIIPNKGEALIVRLPEWRLPLILKDDVFIIPLRDDEYWIGSYYQPWPDNPFPSATGKAQLLRGLSKMYPGPVDILHHLSGIRPTVDDRRPVIGAFPGRSNVYLFNGMGTKATSLAPYWAEQLAGHIFDSVSLPTAVSPERY